MECMNKNGMREGHRDKKGRKNGGMTVAEYNLLLSTSPMYGMSKNKKWKMISWNRKNFIIYWNGGLHF